MLSKLTVSYSKHERTACPDLGAIAAHTCCEQSVPWQGLGITFRSEQALVRLAVPRKASTAVSWLQASKALVSQAASQNSLQLLRLYMLMPASSASRTASGLRLAACRRLPARRLRLPADIYMDRWHNEQHHDLHIMIILHTRLLTLEWKPGTSALSDAGLHESRGRVL